MTIKTVWIDTLYRIATGSRSVRNIATPIGAMVYGLFVFGFVAISLYLDWILGFKNIFPTPINYILSLPILLFALLLIGWSVKTFLAVKGTPVPFNPPPELVTTGPYAFTRNPMLTGVFSMLFGCGVLFGSISLLFVFTPVFIYINYWEIKSIEEPELKKRLGEDYFEYRKRTPMFFPNFIKLFTNRKQKTQ